MLHNPRNKNTGSTDSYKGVSETVPVCIFHKTDFYREIIVCTLHQNTA